MRSNQLDMELKEKDNKLKIHEHEIAVQDEVGFISHNHSHHYKVPCDEETPII